MRGYVRVWLAAALAASLAPAVHAQHFPPPVDEPTAAQPVPPEPPAKATKKKKAARPAPEAPPPVVNLPVDPDGVPPPAETAPPAPGAPPARARASVPAHAVACGGGAFAKNSSHLKLAQIFGAQNITFTEVDGPQNSKLPATVLYPKDPKRHLEVLWSNQAARADTSVVVINGQSTWSGPKGLRLGLPIAALEKLNGKPFQLAGFDQDNAGTALDWQGGALEKVPGGCKVGLRLAPDAKASADARSAAAGKTLMSNDAVVRAVNPKVAEILIGY